MTAGIFNMSFEGHSTEASFKSATASQASSVAPTEDLAAPAHRVPQSVLAAMEAARTAAVVIKPNSDLLHLIQPFLNHDARGEFPSISTYTGERALGRSGGWAVERLVEHANRPAERRSRERAVWRADERMGGQAGKRAGRRKCFRRARRQQCQ